MRSTTWTLRRRFRVEKAESYDKILLNMMLKEEEQSVPNSSDSNPKQNDLENPNTMND